MRSKTLINNTEAVNTGYTKTTNMLIQGEYIWILNH